MAIIQTLDLTTEHEVICTTSKLWTFVTLKK